MWGWGGGIKLHIFFELNSITIWYHSNLLTIVWMLCIMNMQKTLSVNSQNQMWSLYTQKKYSMNTNPTYSAHTSSSSMYNIACLGGHSNILFSHKMFQPFSLVSCMRRTSWNWHIHSSQTQKAINFTNSCHEISNNLKFW